MSSSRTTLLSFGVSSLAPKTQAESSLSTDGFSPQSPLEGRKSSVDAVDEFPCDRNALLNRIKSCRGANGTRKARVMHADLVKRDLLSDDVHLATALLGAYADCGALLEAREILDQMSKRDVVSWTTLITSYFRHGLGHEALKCFKEMRDQGVRPDGVTYIFVLKACGITKSLQVGEDIDAEIRGQGLLQKNAALGSALIDMYLKCGALEKARSVFEQLSFRDVVTWTVLISGYAQHGYGEEALKCFTRMQKEGVCPNAITYASILKACGIARSLEIGEEVSSKVRELGLLRQDHVLGAALLDMYAKCGALERAQEIFEQLEQKNTVAWTAMISGYTEHGLNAEALQCFRRMQDEGISPDVVTYICALKACGTTGSLETGQSIDAEVRRKGLVEKDAILGTALVDMYAKCGLLEKAEEVFEQLPVQDVVSWSAMVTGYAHHGQDDKILKSFKQMRDEGVCPDAAIYVRVLKACAAVRCLEIGEDICDAVRKQGLLQSDTILGAALVDMYGKCSAPEKAQGVFEELPKQDVVCWTALIAGYVQRGLCEKALMLFKQMQDCGVRPNAVTYVLSLKACAAVRSLELGETINAEITKQGLLWEDATLGTSLVDMYAKCGSLEKAREVFDNLQKPDVVSWNALLTGYVQYGHADDAISCFTQMKDQNKMSPDAVTYICILKACGIARSLHVGEEVDLEIRRQGLLETDVVLGNALLDMYVRCGALGKAQDVFKDLPVQDVVSWTTLLRGFVEWGLGDDALRCYVQMREDGVSPDIVTYVCGLKACGVAGSLATGKEIHTEIRRQGLLQTDMVLGTTLVDMYARCGAVHEAEEVFEQLGDHNVVTWTAFTAGYAQHGEANTVFELLERMKTEGILPGPITFLVFLSACSHAGLVKEGEKLLEDMCVVYGLTPTVQHYACMIDLLSRAGQFDKAQVLVENASHLDKLPLVLALLGACCKWVNVTVGKWAFETALRLDQNCVAAYVCMENLYATAEIKAS